MDAIEWVIIGGFCFMLIPTALIYYKSEQFLKRMDEEEKSPALNSQNLA